MSIESHAAAGIQRAKKLSAISRESEQLKDHSVLALAGVASAPAWKLWISRYQRQAAVLQLGDRSNAIARGSDEGTQALRAIAEFLPIQFADEIGFAIGVTSLCALAGQLTEHQVSTLQPSSQGLIARLNSGCSESVAAGLFRAAGMLMPRVDEQRCRDLAVLIEEKGIGLTGQHVRLWGAFALVSFGHEVRANLEVIGRILQLNAAELAIEAARNLPFQAGDALNDLMLTSIPRDKSELVDRPAIEAAIQEGAFAKRFTMKMELERKGLDDYRIDSLLSANELLRKHVALRVADDVMQTKVEALQAIILLGPRATLISPVLDSMSRNELPSGLRPLVTLAMATVGTSSSSTAVDPLEEQTQRTIEEAVMQAKVSRCARCDGRFEWPPSFKSGPIPIPAHVVDKAIYCSTCLKEFCIKCVRGACPECGNGDFEYVVPGTTVGRANRLSPEAPH